MPAMRALLSFSILSVLSLGGCASLTGDVVPFPQQSAVTPAQAHYANAAMPQPAYAQQAPAQAGVAQPQPAMQPVAWRPNAGDGGGSIFASAADGSGQRGLRLYQDNKAREVGDLLTVVLVERTSASANARTGINKNSDISMGAPTLFGQTVTHNGKNLLEAEVEAERGFNGQGQSSQSNQLAGNITVTVVERLGNGNLRVAGEKQLRLNQGDELVQVQGIVRTADIGPDNRIASDRVGDARILYGGRGAMARSNAMGWLGRFFNSAAAPY